MPVRAPRICRCGFKVASGALCQCQQKRAQERKAAFDAKRPSATERGYGSRWQKARLTFLLSHPRCSCGANATVVDHIEPHRGDKLLFWDTRNWQPLCARCHNSRKQSIEKGRR